MFFIFYFIIIGLAGLNSLPEKPQKPALTKVVPVKSKSKTESKEGSFVKWYNKNKKNLQEEFPEGNVDELTKIGLTRFKEETAQSNADNTAGPSELFKKRKLSSSDNEHSEAKRAVSSKLNSFAFEK